MKKTPCMNCTDRQFRCHTTCERYIAFKEAGERYKENRKKVRDLEYYKGERNAFWSAWHAKRKVRWRG